MLLERADRVRREIGALAAAGLAVDELLAAAIRIVGSSVGAELTCWGAIDPETLVITTMVNGEQRIPAQYEPLLAQTEYGPTVEPHRWAALAARRTALALSSDLPDSARRHSVRLNEIWRPLGLDRELRVVLLADGACWGGAGLVRAGRDFTDAEQRFLALVAPAVAGATRLAVRARPHDPASGHQPAILVLGPQGDLRAVTPAAREWRERLDELAPGRFALMMQVMLAGARAGAAGGFRARVRDAHGEWALLHASPLLGDGDDSVAVVVEPATGEQVIGILAAAYALTAREAEVCREVLAGYSTADIAAHLFISSNTVQDHLKAVFAKVGVRSRGELGARLRAAPGSGRPPRRPGTVGLPARRGDRSLDAPRTDSAPDHRTASKISSSLSAPAHVGTSPNAATVSVAGLTSR